MVDVLQPEAKLAPAVPKVCILKRRKFPRTVGGATEILPDVAVVLIVVKSCHAPHVELFVESENCTLYPVMELLVPPAAPLHESVTFPSANV